MHRLARFVLPCVLPFGCGETGVTQLMGRAPTDAGTECSGSFSPEIIGRAETTFQRPGAPGLALSTEGAYFVDWGEDGQSHLYLLNAETGVLEDRAQAPVLTLIDAEASWVVTREGTLQDDLRWVIRRPEHGELQIPETSSDLSPFFYSDGPEVVRVIDSGRVAIETSATVGVYELASEQTYETLLPGRSTEPPSLRWPYLAYGTGSQLTIWNVADSWRQWQWRSEDLMGFRQFGFMDAGWVALRNGRAVHGSLPQPGEPEVPSILSDRTCFSVHATGSEAVFVCDPDGEPVVDGLGLGKTLVVWDGTQSSTLDLGEDRASLARISGRRVAYLHFASGTDFCSMPGGGGEIVVRNLDTHERQVVSRVGYGCLCCNAYWPLNRLLFEGDLLAWTYDVDEGSPKALPTSYGIGLARIGEKCE